MGVNLNKNQAQLASAASSAVEAAVHEGISPLWLLIQLRDAAEKAAMDYEYDEGKSPTARGPDLPL